MRILYVNPTADLYGASRSLLRLTTSLNPQIYSPLVMLPQEGSLADTLRAHNIPVHINPLLAVIRRNVFTSWRLIPFLFSLIPAIFYCAWLIHRYKIDVVHSNTGVVFIPALAARLTGARHVWHVREMFADEFGKLWHYYRPFMLKFADKIICVSTPIAAQFPATSQVQVVHNGFDLSEFVVNPAEAQKWRNHYAPEPDIQLVAIVGRISPRKGQDVFVRACHLLKGRGYTNVRYLIVGDVFSGNEYVADDLKSFIADHGLAETVLFTGFLEDPKPLIAALDILVMPSTLPEAFPGVVLEGLALAVPVIGTALGGTVEQIEHGSNGLLILPNDPQALADALASLLDDPVKSKQMGQVGRHIVETRFNLATMRTKMEAIYQEMEGKTVR